MNTLTEQINWFTPFQEENFIEIYNDSNVSTFAKCSFHYFIPHKNINSAEDIEKIMKPSKDIENYIGIRKDEVTRTDIYIIVEVSMPIEGKGQDKKYNKGISSLLEVVAKYLNQLATNTGKRIKSAFPNAPSIEEHRKIIDIATKYNGFVNFPALTINIDNEYDFSHALSLNINEQNLVDSVKENKNISIDDNEFLGLEGNYKEIIALSEYEINEYEGDKTETRTKQDINQLLDIMIEFLNKYNK